MKIRTTEQLIDKLGEDLAWRKRELSAIKSLVETKSFSQPKHQVLVRSAICILYSHWEGFVKSASNYYVEYVRRQELTYQEISSNFLALAMKEQLKTAKETNKPSLYIPVCEFFISQLYHKCILPKDQDTISTGSNLSSEVLKEITAILGLNFDDYSTKSKYIDEKLLKRRNQIAHGEYCIVNSSDYVELHQEIIAMLDIFRNQIEISAIEGKFRKVRP